MPGAYKMVNYSELPYLTLAAVRRLKTRNDQKDEQIRTLTDRVQALETLQKELLAALARLRNPR